MAFDNLGDVDPELCAVYISRHLIAYLQAEYNVDM